MTVYTDVRNPVALADGRINCDILHEVYGWIPFTAAPDDTEEYARDLHAALLAGDYGTVVPYVPPDPAVVAAAELQAWREAAILTRLQFALQAATDGAMTAAEAEAFAGSGAIPQLGEDALALIENLPARIAARIRFAGAQTIARLDPFMPALKQAAGWTDAQLDAFFQAGAAL